MKVLITGGFGFLGGRLAQCLGCQGQYTIRLGSRGVRSAPAWCAGATVVQTPWDDLHALESACNGVEAIVHLSARNAADCAADPAGALLDNTVATARLLQVARQTGVSRFIYLSTAHVYGSPLTGRITEETLTNAVHPYAASHLAAEGAVRYAHQQGDIEGIVVRLSNAFGAPASAEANCWMLLINDLCRQAARSRQIKLHSSGMQRRDFVAMGDACAGLERLLTLPLDDLEQPLLNLGGDWAPTVLDVAERIVRRCEAVLGYRPALIRPEGVSREPEAPFHYGIERFKAIGYMPQQKIDDEIDALLTLSAKEGKTDVPT